MRYFFDTEFIEDGQSVTLLSLGLVAADGRSYYAENSTADLGNANAFVIANVIPLLGRDPNARKTPLQIRDDLLKFIGRDKPEFWGYYCAYDWVLFSQLFGDFDSYHKLCGGWPMMCLDVEQLRLSYPNATLPPPPVEQHHALADAQWVQAAWRAITEQAAAQPRRLVGA